MLEISLGRYTFVLQKLGTDASYFLACMAIAFDDMYLLLSFNYVMMIFCQLEKVLCIL